MSLTPEEVDRIKRILPYVCDDDTIEQLYKTCNSIAQGRRSSNGRRFEELVASCLRAQNIPFVSQVSIDDKTGCIVPRSRGKHVYDFVIDAQVGDLARDKDMVSCKTSLRERYLQDQKSPFRTSYMLTLEKTSNPAKFLRHDIQVISVSDATIKDILRSLYHH